MCFQPISNSDPCWMKKILLPGAQASQHQQFLGQEIRARNPAPSMCSVALGRFLLALCSLSFLLENRDHTLLWETQDEGMRWYKPNTQGSPAPRTAWETGCWHRYSAPVLLRRFFFFFLTLLSCCCHSWFASLFFSWPAFCRCFEVHIWRFQKGGLGYLCDIPHKSRREGTLSGLVWCLEIWNQCGEPIHHLRLLQRKAGASGFLPVIWVLAVGCWTPWI